MIRRERDSMNIPFLVCDRIVSSKAAIEKTSCIPEIDRNKQTKQNRSSRVAHLPLLHLFFFSLFDTKKSSYLFLLKERGPGKESHEQAWFSVSLFWPSFISQVSLYLPEYDRRECPLQRRGKLSFCEKKSQFFIRRPPSQINGQVRSFQSLSYKLTFHSNFIRVLCSRLPPRALSRCFCTSPNTTKGKKHR
jgi:hypothetical protein